MDKKNPILQFINLPKDAKNVCFLHSGGKNGKSILAWNPIEKYSYKKKGDSSFEEGIKNFIRKHKDKRHKIIGYFAYDTAYELYKIKNKAKDDLKLPDVYFMAFDKWLEIRKNKNSKNRDKITTSKYKSTNFRPEMLKSTYTKAYNKIKHHIKEGDIYQINLTHRLKGETRAPSRELFVKVIEENPVDFLAYIEGDGFEVLSASPERFIKIEGQKIETCPVKGTRVRGKTKKEDEKMKKTLIESEKEAAELNMITDLLRNDLGKVCKISSVKVVGHRLLSECPTVWHTYSKICGKLAVSPIEALMSMLPGGSITGCPKKRAIEIIDELEPTTRGIYTGIIGHIEPNGDMDFNIAIRTIIKKGDKVYLQVGGGIVLDSTNKAELSETLDKASSFMKVL